MTKLKKHLKNIHNKSEEDRIKIMWIAVVFCMIVILGGWFITYRTSNRENRVANKASHTPSLSDLQNSINNMAEQKDDTIEKVTDLIQKAEIESIALIYLKENELASNDDILNLKLENIEKLENNWHLEHRQCYQDIPVNNSKISFLINNAEKKVISYSSNFDPDVNLSSVEPKITEEEAYEIAREDLSNALDNENFDLKNSELVIYKKENKDSAEYFLTWKLNIFSLEPLCDYSYFIDAENSKLVSFSNNTEN